MTEPATGVPGSADAGPATSGTAVGAAGHTGANQAAAGGHRAAAGGHRAASAGPTAAAPATGLWSVLGSVDAVAEGVFDRGRGRPGLDTAARVLSNLSDYGFAWAVLAAVKARRPGPSRRRSVAALAVAGVSSATVNTAVKRLVRRQRPAPAVVPTPAGRVVLPVRRPTSSSFPSGHTLAAFCTAVTLPDRPAEVGACLALATGVAASRVHLQAHHASDVLGGAVLGTAVGLLARRVVSRVTATGSGRSVRARAGAL